MDLIQLMVQSRYRAPQLELDAARPRNPAYRGIVTAVAKPLRRNSRFQTSSAKLVDSVKFYARFRIVRFRGSQLFGIPSGSVCDVTRIRREADPPR